MRRPRLPAFTHTIRFRLTVLYSAILFGLTALVLGGAYYAVERTGEAHPVTKEFRVKKYVGDTYIYDFSAVKMRDVEARVNYETLANLRRFAFPALGGLAAASLGIGWILSGRALRPVRAIARTADDIQAAGDLSRRIRLDGPKDELRMVADTVDSMLDRLEESFKAQRQLVDDASHELRSPLAIIRASLDAVLTSEQSDEEERKRAVRVVDRATTRMTRLVEDLLATARRTAPAFAETDTDLAAAAAEACEEFQPLAAERGLTIRPRLTTGLTLLGDHDALRRAVGNLLSNAVRLAPSGSSVTVATGRTDGWLWAAVEDAGPGIEEGDQARVFDRFWRDGRAPAGRDRHAGLGLAIVRQITESHGGQVRLHSRLGQGSTFVLWFPSAAEPRDGGPPDASPLDVSGAGPSSASRGSPARP